MKLLPNQGVQAMRPVRVTTPGASLSLPLRMAAIGTGATVGITIWVVSDGATSRRTFPFFHIDDSELVWDWSTSSSNYTTLRAQNEAALGGKGWEIESSLTLNEQLITQRHPERRAVLRLGGGFVGGARSRPRTRAQDYLAGRRSGRRCRRGGLPDAQTRVRTADIAALFAGMPGPNVRVTRMRSDISHAAMTTDFVLQASADQSELSNVRNVTKSVNLVCPVYPDCASGSGGGSLNGPVGGSGSTARNAGSGPAPRRPANDGGRLRGSRDRSSRRARPAGFARPRRHDRARRCFASSGAGGAPQAARVEGSLPMNAWRTIHEDDEALRSDFR